MMQLSSGLTLKSPEIILNITFSQTAFTTNLNFFHHWEGSHWLKACQNDEII